MKTLISGTFFDDSHINVLPLPSQGKEILRVEVKRPKIIVGMSILLPEEEFASHIVVFPVIVDTGCNVQLEIDERHLYNWVHLDKKWLGLIERRGAGPKRARGYDIRQAKILIHPDPYMGPKFVGSKAPIHLTESDEVRVMDDTTTDPVPRFPLLGLEALTTNKMNLEVDGPKKAFRLLR